MNKKEWEGNMLPQGGSSGSGWIGPSVATQSKYDGLSKNPPWMTLFYLYIYNLQYE